MWGAYITTFVFWVGIAHSGTLISAVLFLFRARWRTAISRAAEAMTVFAVMTAGLFPIIHLGRPWLFYWLLPYPNQRGLWVNFRSPLLWDVFAIGTYFTVSVLFFYLGLVPDLAILRDNSTGWKRRIFSIASLGWSGSTREWKHFNSSYLLMAALATPLVISVHSVVSWDFAVAIVPGWHSTLFAPYFVAGAIFSGLAMVLTLIIPARKILHLEEYVTPSHLENVAKLILFTSLIVSYSYVIEFFFAWYSQNSFEQTVFMSRLVGDYAPLFWLMVVCNCLTPMLFSSLPPPQHRPFVCGLSIDQCGNVDGTIRHHRRFPGPAIQHDHLGRLRSKLGGVEHFVGKPVLVLILVSSFYPPLAWPSHSRSQGGDDSRISSQGFSKRRGSAMSGVLGIFEQREDLLKAVNEARTENLVRWRPFLLFLMRI